MNTRPELIGGRSNSAPLTKIGRCQALALKERWIRSGAFWDAAYASPAVRAQDTLRIALGQDVEIVSCNEIQELCQGAWEGQLRAEVYTRELREQIEKANGTMRAPGGESPLDVQHRMRRWLDAVSEQHLDGANIVACSHGYAIRALAGWIAGWSFNDIFSKSSPNTSITVVEGAAGHWTLVAFADSAHLDDMDMARDVQ